MVPAVAAAFSEVSTLAPRARSLWCIGKRRSYDQTQPFSLASRLSFIGSSACRARSGLVSRLPEHACGNVAVARFGFSGSWLRPDCSVTCVQPRSQFHFKACSCCGFPTEAMPWITEAEMVDSLDGLKSSRSMREHHVPKMLDSKIASKYKVDFSVEDRLRI